MRSFRDCKVNHIHRERNMVVDYLAKKSTEQELGLWKLDFAPDFVTPLILDEIDGFVRYRLISAISAASWDFLLICFEF